MMNIIAVVVIILGILVALQIYLGLKAQLKPRVTGKAAMKGETGIVTKVSGFRKRSVVEIRGELWWCSPAERECELKKGATVEVVDIEDDTMLLKVKPVRD